MVTRFASDVSDVFELAVIFVALPVRAPTKVVALTVLANVALWSALPVRKAVATPPAVVLRSVNVLLLPVPAVIVMLLAPPVISATEVSEPVISAEPLNACPQRFLEVRRVDAVLAFPDKAPVNLVEPKLPVEAS